MELFKQADESTQKSATGLIERAAYLYSLCSDLEAAIGSRASSRSTRSILRSRSRCQRSRSMRASEAYANIVNKLNGLLSKHQVDDDDGLGSLSESGYSAQAELILTPGCWNTSTSARAARSCGSRADATARHAP